MEKEFEESKLKKKNRKILKIIGLIFLVILNIVIGLSVVTPITYTYYRIGSYVSPTLQEVDARNRLAGIIKIIACAIYVIYVFCSFIYVNSSKETTEVKKRKLLLWLSNCLIMSLMLFCGFMHFYIL